MDMAAEIPDPGSSDTQIAEAIKVYLAARKDQQNALAVLEPEIREPVESIVRSAVCRFPALRDEAGDLSNEVFVKIIRRLDQYDPIRGPLRPWASLVAKNCVIDRCRSLNTGCRGLCGNIDDENLTAVLTDASVYWQEYLDDMGECDCAEVFERAQLSPEQSAVIRLTVLGDESITQTSCRNITLAKLLEAVCCSADLTPVVTELSEFDTYRRQHEFIISAESLVREIAGRAEPQSVDEAVVRLMQYPVVVRQLVTICPLRQTLIARVGSTNSSQSRDLTGELTELHAREYRRLRNLREAGFDKLRIYMGDK